MITVNCDACEKPFQVPDDKVGGKVPCPSCGDVKVIPGVAGSPVSAAGDRAAAIGLPPATGPEAVAMRIHSAIFRARPVQAFMVFMGALAGLVGAVAFSITAVLPMAILCGVVLAACLIIVGLWKITSWATRLEITNKRVVFTRGILSKTTVEMLHRTIQDIEIKQSAFDRMLNVGTISIANASEDDDAILIENVPDPYRIRKTIDAYRPM